MTERQLQFRVGLFVVMAIGVGATLIIQFSELKDLWKETYQLAVHFDELSGVRPGCPVTQHGISIGSVREVAVDKEQSGVLAVLDIQEDYKLRADARPHVSRSLLGDAKIEFTAGRSEQTIPPRSRLQGLAESNPMEAIQHLENTVNTTLASFEATSREWQQVGRSLNELMETNRGNLNVVIERTAGSLDNFNRTMESASTTFQEAGETLKIATHTLSTANSLISDPQLQADLRQTAAALPRIADETRQTISAARTSISMISQNLDTIQRATLPLATESDVIVRKLSGSLIQLESLLTELNHFSQALNTRDGTLQRMASDPELYRNLSRSTANLSILLENLEPVMRDVHVFTDKVARHPELLGVSGAMRGSSGLKDAGEVQQTGHYNSPPQR